MNSGMYLKEPSPTREHIEQDLVSLIAKISILNLMSEGMARGDDRVGMAFEEISRQLDQQARRLLESWEYFTDSLPENREQERRKPDKLSENGFL